MFKRVLALLLFAASSGAAGAQQAGMKADPDVKVKQAGPVPAGWEMQLDSPTASKADVAFTTMGKGMHVTTGPAAIFWNPANTAAGAYTLKATFTQMKASMHPEAYGLVFAGQKLGTSDVSYLYFIVRQDGKFMVKHRANAKDVHLITDWTAAPSVATIEGSGKATNTLEVRTGADSVRLFVNGAQVSAYGANVMTPVAGTYGIRVNHNLDVHVEGLEKR